jgi:two-component system, LytTR family, sensor kinase
MKRKNIILIHFFFWFYIINQGLFPLYTGQLDEAFFVNNKYLKEVFLTTILNVISFYMIYYSFPRLLKYRNRIVAIATGLVLITVITLLRVPVEYYFWKIFGNSGGKEMVYKTEFVWNNLRLVIIIGIYAVLIRFMINWFETQKLRDELINQKQAGELALLKSQVNPHFLFNTLNNIYSLVYRKSDEAPAALMKLSSIMRYMLYDSTHDMVPLEKEVEYLRSFIELQNLRIKHPDFVRLTVEGNMEGRFIAPMLLISFVENAFKHGSRNHRPGIIIHLSALDAQLNFEVINYLKYSATGQDETANGISLGNIKRRLELIYPHRHTFSINKDSETFRINLQITN